jgi:hypothetical protein
MHELFGETESVEGVWTVRATAVVIPTCQIKPETDRSYCLLRNDFVQMGNLKETAS